jgi:LPS sulfotransferase NodH
MACWILCTPRTGSSILCELLNNLGVFQPFDHPNLVHHRGPLEVGQAFNEWPRLYFSPQDFLSHPCRYSKMIFHQYIESFASIPKQERYNVGWYPRTHDPDLTARISKQYDSRFADRLFPGIRFLHLHREPISHAVSLYFARSTKKYHIYSQEALDEYLRMQIQPDHNKLLEAYRDALAYDKCWRNFLSGGERLMHVDYNSLLFYPEDTLTKIVEFLGVDGDIKGSIDKCLGDKKRIYKMTRPESREYYELLQKLVSGSMLP